MIPRIQSLRRVWIASVILILLLSLAAEATVIYLTDTNRQQAELSRVIGSVHSIIDQSALYAQMYVLVPNANVRDALRLSMAESANDLVDEMQDIFTNDQIRSRWQNLSAMFGDVSERLGVYSQDAQRFTDIPPESVTPFSAEYTSLLDQSGRLKRDLDSMWNENRIRLNRIADILLMGNRARLAILAGILAIWGIVGFMPLLRYVNNTQARTHHALQYSVSTEATLRQRETFLKGILSAVPGMVFVYDLQTNRNVFVNRGALWLIGDQQSNTTSNVDDGFAILLDTIHPEDLPALLQFSAAVRQGSDAITRFTGRLLGMDGVTRWVQLTALPFSRDDGGRITQIVGLGQDITTQKTIEESLREQRHFVERIADTVPDTIYIYDLIEQRNIYVNREIWNLLGYTPDELQAFGSDLFPELMHPEDYPRVIEGQRRFDTARDGESIENEFRMRHRNGLWHNLYTRDTIFKRDSDGRATQILGVVQDVTERKKSVRQAIALGIEREKVQILSSFITSASHEFRTPLTIISSDIYLLGHTEDPEKRYARLRRIEKQTDYLARLVDQLVEMSTLDSYAEVDRANVNLETLIAAALDPFQSQANSAHVTLHVGVDPAADTLSCDAKLIALALHNLIENALRYAPWSSVIEIATGRVEDGLFISVEDAGEGIPHGHQACVFDRFYKGNTARTQDGSGAGLGLSIVKKVVDLHKGRIEMRSSPNHGAKFTLIFPIEQPVTATQTIRLVQL